MRIVGLRGIVNTFYSIFNFIVLGRCYTSLTRPQGVRTSETEYCARERWRIWMRSCFVTVVVCCSFLGGCQTFLAMFFLFSKQYAI